MRMFGKIFYASFPVQNLKNCFYLNPNFVMKNTAVMRGGRHCTLGRTPLGEPEGTATLRAAADIFVRGSFPSSSLAPAMIVSCNIPAVVTNHQIKINSSNIIRVSFTTHISLYGVSSVQHTQPYQCLNT